MATIESKCVPKVVLNSSVGHQSISILGFGTASNNTGLTLLKIAALEVIKLGYCHFDTASLYGSEQALGEAIAEALKLGLVVLGMSSLSLPSSRYLDLYRVHWPISSKPEKGQFPIKEEDIIPMDYKSVWAAMEESQRLGLTKSIRVSNFSTKKLQNMLSFATIPPAVNQLEMNPIWQQRKLIKFCKPNNIIVTAYSPLGAIGTTWGSNNVMDNQVLKDIALARGKIVAQVCLRWIYEQGATSVPKSYNKERLKENLDIFDWELTQDDLHKISQLPQKKLILNVSFGNGTNPNYLQELWDGEL